MKRLEALYNARDIGAELDRIQGRLAGLGLMKTMQAVNRASQALGWELSAALEKEEQKA